MSGENKKRVVSLIASATEVVCALGRRNWLVGRSHECDFPLDVADLPALTAPKFRVEGTSAQIDARVQDIVRDGLSVYRVDGDRLRQLQPDIIVTQDHCEVCAVSLSDVEAATCTWTDRSVSILSLRPDSLTDVYTDIRKVAFGLETTAAGEALVGDICARLLAITELIGSEPKPRVAFVEWVEPLMCGGNWMPELIATAGGINLFGSAGKHSGWMQWDELVASDPEIIVVAPCGYGLERCRQEQGLLEAKPGWRGLRAVRTGRVYFADGNAYFNRPGPRLADSAEMLVEILHPRLARKNYEGYGWMRLSA
jgi:iron complex transport system substrate-binding protein